ncbi:MAG: site-specific integrase [Acidobacteria bacterium]|nr:site-specific integrase [Acidobacteriota bacterium]
MIEFCLLTGCRTREMLRLEWNDVDWEGSWIHFRNIKTAHDRVVAMWLELRMLLNNLRRFEGSSHVFPNPKTGKPFGHYSTGYSRSFPQFPRKPWKVVCERANLTDSLATPHTFRRTVGTILAKNLGLQADAEILGHSDPSITRRYAGVLSETYDRAAQVLETSLAKANDSLK